MDTILVIDDDEGMRNLLMELLSNPKRSILKTDSALNGLKILKNETVDLVLTDIHMPDINGIEFIKRAQESNITAPIITITAYASTDTAVQALRAGAYDYLSKPFAHEELLKIVENTLQARHLFQEVTYLRGKLDKQYSLENMIGQSKLMQKAFEIIERVSNCDCNILITGASGTGKELVARAIHNISDRKDKPFVPINCAAIPENLLESELFGHTKGAFTGAVSNKSGLIEIAHGGTLFLDEIGDMPISLQAKLLRVIQDHNVQRVGSTSTNPIDVRIVAATNQDLKESIRKQMFRKDLYYRLDVVGIKLPPLCQRGNDIILLANHFLKQHSERLNKAIQGFSRPVLKAFETYSWPGNVRELENAVEHAITLCRSERIDLCDLPGSIQEDLESVDLSSTTLHKQVLHYEHQAIQKTLEKCNGDFHLASKKLGISLATLYRKINRYKQTLSKRKISDITDSGANEITQPQLFDIKNH